VFSELFLAGVQALSAAYAMAAEPAADATKREPFRLVNDAGFTASCSLLIIDDSIEAVKLHPGETYSRRIPMKRELRLVCIKGKTRQVALSPGQTYRLIEVDGHLEIAREGAILPP
jgi:hypothetical protein